MVDQKYRSGQSPTRLTNEFPWIAGRSFFSDTEHTMTNPAELPEGGEGVPTPPLWNPTAAWWGTPPGWRPPPGWRGPGWGPAELPPEVETGSVLNELVKLRDRVHQVETELLMARIGRRPGGPGGPAELPPAPTVQATAFARPPAPEIAEIAEFPAPDSLVQQIAHLVDQRITALGEQLRAEIDSLRQQIAR